MTTNQLERVAAELARDLGCTVPEARCLMRLWAAREAAKRPELQGLLAAWLKALGVAKLA